jgi:NAD(P)-dependent dehydrogenase (short-subunit alcohol dehydrogenase family)
MTDPCHLLLVGAGPGLGAAIARRFAREGYRLALIARSPEPVGTIAQELRAAGADVAVVQAYAGDPERLRAALSPLVEAPDAPRRRDLQLGAHDVRRPAHGQP